LNRVGIFCQKKEIKLSRFVFKTVNIDPCKVYKIFILLGTLIPMLKRKLNEEELSCWYYLSETGVHVGLAITVKGQDQSPVFSSFAQSILKFKISFLCKI
jgi:hypothetical protein